MSKSRAKCPRCAQVMEYEEGVAERLTCSSCQATLALPRKPPPAPKTDPLVGQKLGEYEIIEVLGRGGMGAVYKARQPSLDRFVALKVVKAGDIDPSFLGRFTREARAAAAVNHPNIIEIYAIGQQGDYHYIAMEFVDGGHLGALIRREGKLSAERALPIMKQTAAAIAQAHAAGIVHRDIKPANILLRGDGLVKMADFGVAKRAQGDVAVTMEGHVVGTVLYMAPEVCAGSPGDARADLYSLGATFYHMLAGTPPFQGTSITQLSLQHNQAPVAPLAEKVPGLPRALSSLVHRLLRKKPAERFASADEVVEAIERVEKTMAGAVADSGTADVPASHLTREARAGAKRQDRNRIILFAGLGSAATVLVLILLAIFLGRGRERPDPGLLAVAPGQPGTPAQVGPKAVPQTATGARADPKAPAWSAGLKRADEKAAAWLTAERFADAGSEYEALARRYDDDALRQTVQEKLSDIRRQAADAYRKTSEQAKQLAAAKAADRACALLQTVIDRYGTDAEVRAARALLAEIKPAEAPSTPPADPKDSPEKSTDTKTPAVVVAPKDDPAKKADPAQKADPPKTDDSKGETPKVEVARPPDDTKAREAEARRIAAFKVAEALIRGWNYRDADAALAELAKKDPTWADAVKQRRDEVALLAKLQAKMIAKINSAQPRLSKRALLIPGANGDLEDANETRISLRLSADAAQGMPWKGLSAKSAHLLAQMAVDPKNADECVASALLALAYEDVATAEKELEAARAAGGQVDRYLLPIADAALAQANALIDKQSFKEAEDALLAVETKYGRAPWFAARKESFDTARHRIQDTTAESAAEKLYKQAAELYKSKNYLELKPLVEKLNADYANSRVVTDAERKPTVAEMGEATETLGKVLTVAREGKADHRSIQSAIDAAPPKSTIVICDNGPYPERLMIPQSKTGLTIRGKRGCWPILGGAAAAQRSYRRLIDVEAADVTLERLVFALRPPAPTRTGGYSSVGCVEIKGQVNFTARYCILSTGSTYSDYIIDGSGGLTILDHCVITNTGSVRAPLYAKNTLSFGRYLTAYSYSSGREVALTVGDGPKAKSVRGARFENCAMTRLDSSGPSDIENCTIAGTLQLNGESNTVVDSIAEQVNATKRDCKIDYCDVYGRNPFVDFAMAGKHCFSLPPLMINPRNLDFRLGAASPCRGRARDGGNLGCRYTKDMAEMSMLAFELKNRKIIDFKPPSADSSGMMY